MRRVMRMTKLNTRDNLLDDLKEILLGPLPDFSCCHCGGRVGDEDGTESLLQMGVVNEHLESIGQINHLL